MKLLLLLLTTVYTMMSFPSCVTSECYEGKPVSLYNLGTGFLAFAKSDETGIDSRRAGSLESAERLQVSWALIYNPDGSVSIRSVKFPELCLCYVNQFFSEPLLLRKCDLHDAKFQFNLRRHESGAFQLVLVSNGKCAYDNGDGAWYGLQTKPCEKNVRKFLFSLIPFY